MQGCSVIVFTAVPLLGWRRKCDQGVALAGAAGAAGAAAASVGAVRRMRAGSELLTLAARLMFEADPSARLMPSITRPSALIAGRPT